MNCLKSEWNKFEAWVHSWFPGLKTKIMLGLGIVGEGSAVLQDFVTGLPTTEFINPKVLSIVSLTLFALAFWFKNMGERVEAKKEEVE